jgi:hypothetical protein
LQSVQVDHLLTHQQLLQTQQRLEFLQLEEDKELKNGIQDNVQEEQVDLEAAVETKPVQRQTLLEVVMLEDILHLKEIQAVVEVEVPGDRGTELEAEAAVLQRQVLEHPLLLKVVMVV